MIEKGLKYVQWLLYGLMGISAILIVLFYMNSSNPDLILYWMYTIAILSIAIILAIVITGIVKNPKGSFKVLIIVAIGLLLGLISYIMSKNTLAPDQLEKYNLTPNNVRMVGAGLLMTYLIMLGAIGVFIYTSVIKYFK
jgi:NADH:ubiquinone oxidoreductase subunit 6 (subunit J)